MHWAIATGTELPLRYKRAIKIAGFEEVPVDGQMSQFQKNEHVVTVVPSTDYVEIILEN